VALEKVHIFDTTKVTIESGRQNNDGNMRTTAAKKGCDLRPKLACAQMVVEDGDINTVEELSCLFNRRGGDTFVAMLTQNGGAKVKVIGLIIKQ
jgi:hypothetical protein